MNIILSTGNPSKALQIQALFSNKDIIVKTLKEVGIEGEAIEDGNTLEENAYKKAKYALDHSDGSTWTMADDTGLFIHALNGEPGIKAARWAGEGKETTTQFALEKMKDLTDHSATFETVVVLLSPSGVKHIFKGQIDGIMLEKPACDPQPKMPYSPLFIPNGQTKCWAEMTTEEENAISHRGIAFRKAIAFLEAQ
ncbi:MAG TPA: non-canonical purine NTP pyrophosphatase [Candidatus Paceibacterota bacterium]|nr:non-canonical purine NTP pyrophosphatase [Candidatus Paceibacterota bacterium]